jgi:hypothetical protein
MVQSFKANVIAMVKRGAEHEVAQKIGKNERSQGSPL